MKGSDIERELEQILLSSGLYLVHRTRQVRTPPRISKDGKKVWGVAMSADIFGVFDFIVVHVHDLVGSDVPMWIQCCSAGAASAHRRKLEEFWRAHTHTLSPFHPLHWNAVLAIRYPRRVWRWQKHGSIGLDGTEIWQDIERPFDISDGWAKKVKQWSPKNRKA